MITLQNYTSEEIDLFSVHSIIKSGDFYNMRLPRLQILAASFSLQAKLIDTTSHQKLSVLNDLVFY